MRHIGCFTEKHSFMQRLEAGTDEQLLPDKVAEFKANQFRPVIAFSSRAGYGHLVAEH